MPEQTLATRQLSRTDMLVTELSLGDKPDGLYLSTKVGTHPARRGDYSAVGRQA